MAELKRLPDSELEAMIAVWQSEQPVAGAQVAQILQERRGWTNSTTFTLLVRLCEKNFIKCEKQGKINLYTSIVNEEEYKQCESRGVLERFYSGSIKNFIAGFCKEKALSHEDLEALRKFVEEKSKEE